MIIFESSGWRWDLTNKGITFNENSAFFSEKQQKNYSFPFNVELTEDTVDKLGLITINEVHSYKQRIYGELTIDNKFYSGYININQIQETRIELTLFYGSETLPVFDKKLKQLPFPVVITSPDLPTFAKAQITKSWPEATHNFVKVFRDEIATDSNYAHFENFVNNYIEEATVWSFPINTIETIDAQQVAVNRNVMCPMIYLIELLRVGFASDGLVIRGDFVNDLFNHKLVIIPENFMEHFSTTQFDNYSFANYTIQETIGGQTVNVYRKTHTPTQTGSYSLKININFSEVMAGLFQLTVIQNGNTLYQASSSNTDVNINETLELNIVDTLVFFDIEVEMKLYQQDSNIDQFNNFTYEFKEGSLNLFPGNYTLSDYLPNITFRELINQLKKWLNLKFDYTDNAVYINYLEDHIQDLVFENKSHLEDPKKKRTLNTNNLFKLTYPDDQTVLFNKDGQTYNEANFIDQEIEDIEIKVLPLPVKSREGIVTAVYPEEAQKIMLTLYDGPVADENTATKSINNRTISLQHVADRHWKNWLKFRANSETVSETFYMHFTEHLDIYNGVFKYNKNMLIKTLRKQRTQEEHYKVTVKSETF